MITKEDIEHLKWIHGRFVDHYNESRHTDYVYRLEKIIEKIEQGQAFDLGAVSHCGLTSEEAAERELLLLQQKDSTTWFYKEDFDRLKELTYKMHKNSGSPHCG